MSIRRTGIITAAVAAAGLGCAATGSTTARAADYPIGGYYGHPVAEDCYPCNDYAEHRFAWRRPHVVERETVIERPTIVERRVVVERPVIERRVIVERPAVIERPAVAVRRAPVAILPPDCDYC